MPGHVDKPSEAGSLRQLAVRVFNLERKLNSKQTDGLVGKPVSLVFAVSSTLTALVPVSAPHTVPWRVQLTRVYARLRVASTSGPVSGQLLLDDGGPWGAFSIPAGQKVAEATLGNQMGPEDWATVQLTAFGTGAAGLTVRVDGYVIART